MPRTVLNDWSPWMQALSGASDDPAQSGDFNMIEDAQRRAAATPAQPSTSAPPAHRIEDDRTAGTRGTTPQSPTTNYDPAAESRAYDPSAGRQALARIPLQTQIGKDQTELDRLNQPTKRMTLMDRVKGAIGGAATGARGEGALEQAATLRDRTEARKLQERESLGSRISANTRAMSEQDIQSQRIDEQERAANSRNQTMADAIRSRERNVDVQQEGKATEGQATRDSRESMQQNAFEQQDRERRAKADDASRMEGERQEGRMAIQRLRNSVAGIRATAQGQKVPSLVGKAFDSYQDSQSRYDIMEQNVIAGKQGDQQAMLSLLANHLGMTMGLAKGARINQAIINEAQQSAPWLGRIQARFDDRGYLSGIVLTPEQMDQMVDLARNRVMEDGRKVTAMQGFMGGPKPPVNSATPDAGGGQKATHRMVNGKIVPIRSQP